MTMPSMSDMSDMSYRALCSEILQHQGKKRRALCRAFTAAFNDLYCSKSLTKLNIFLKIVELLPEKSKLLAACRVYLGGVELDAKGDFMRRDDLCCAVLAQHVLKVPGKSEPGKKTIAKDEKLFIFCENKKLFSEAKTLWDTRLRSIDFDCLTVRSAKKEVTAEELVKFFRRLEKSRQNFRENDAVVLEDAITWAKTNKII